VWQLSAALLQNAPPEISKRACFDTVGAYRREWSKWDTSGEYGLEFAGIIGAITRRRVRATETSRLDLCQRVQDASNTIRAPPIPRMRPRLRCGRLTQERKGCGAHHQMSQKLARAALRFARPTQKFAHDVSYWLIIACRESGLRERKLSGSSSVCRIGEVSCGAVQISGLVIRQLDRPG